MPHLNSKLAADLARLAFLSGYVRVLHAQRLSQIEAQTNQAFQRLCVNGLETEAQEVRQIAERIGHSMGIGEAPPEWLTDYEQEIVQRIAALG